MINKFRLCIHNLYGYFRTAAQKGFFSVQLDMMKVDSLFYLCKLVLFDFLKRECPGYDIDNVLDKAVKWLCRAQYRTNDGGVSEGYHLIR